MEKKRKLLPNPSLLRDIAQDPGSSNLGSNASPSAESGTSKLTNERERLIAELELRNAELIVAKELAEESLEKHRLLIDNINDLICEIDENGVYTYVSQQYSSILGYHPDELIGKNATELIHPDDLLTSAIQYEVLKQSRGKSTDIWRFKHKDGNYRIIESKGTVYTDLTKGIRTVVISRDITGKKQAEEALSVSEKKYRILHESMMDGFAYVSMDGKILEYNLTYQKMLGYDAEELLQLSYPEITPGKWHHFEQEIIERQVLVHGFSEVYHKEYRRKDGTIFPVELRAFLVRDEQHKALGMWAIVRDITDRKRAEENLLQLNKQLTDLNAMKDKLFSIIAHDLRSPFNSILGFSELLSGNIRGYDIEKTEDYINRINFTARQTHYLLENLLTWARTQTGQLDFNPENTSLQPIIRQIVDILNSSARIKDISLNYFQSEDISIYADINMLKSILRNLLSNAIKFTRSGGKVDIYAISDLHQVKITIEDNGVGMNEETRTGLFLNNTNLTTKGTAKEKGSGLGLILCKEFVEKHGGKIWVESDEGKGSKFQIIFPKI